MIFRALLIVGFCAASSFAQPSFDPLTVRYAVKKIETMGEDMTLGYSINARGQVAGYCRHLGPPAALVPFLWTPASDAAKPGRIKRVGNFSSTHCIVRSINDRGWVAGTFQDAKNKARGFYSTGGKIVVLQIAGEAGAYAINNRGQIAGWVRNRSGGYGFVFTVGKRNIVNLGTRVRPAAINDRGQIAGEFTVPGKGSEDTHAFIYDRGKLVDLGTLGGKKSHATAINESGWVVGWAETGKSAANATGRIVKESLPFLWTPDGGMKSLGTIPADGLEHAQHVRMMATGINDDGVIVGKSNFGAFVYHKGKMVNLAPLVQSKEYPDNFFDQKNIQDVNNKGWILAPQYVLVPIIKREGKDD